MLKNLFFIFCFSQITFSQEVYNNCISALELCPNQSYVVRNFNSNKTLCNGCEDDFSSLLCFPARNTIWLKFQTNNIGGDISFLISSIAYVSKPNQSTGLQASILEATNPCFASTYSQVGTCVTDGNLSMTLTASNLSPSKFYYIVISGDLNGTSAVPAEAEMKVTITGSAVDRVIPSLILDPIKPMYCFKAKSIFSAQLLNCKDSSLFEWFINDVLVAKTDSVYVQFSELNKGDVLKVKNTCFSSCPVQLESSSTPINVFKIDVYAGLDTLINEGTSALLKGVCSSSIFNWTPANLISKNELITSVSPMQSTRYFLTGKQYDCSFSDEVTVFVKPKNPIPPNTFSPNNDGINDVWDIPFLVDFPNNNVLIYNRWGNIVFEMNGYSYLKSWNGLRNGIPVDEGSYYYHIDLRDPFIDSPITGVLTVIR